jgi:hypothetical protein
MTGRLDAELILMSWDEASDDDRRAAAGYGAAELDAALTHLEAELPVIAEKVCGGHASVRDFRAMQGVYRCGEAIQSWARVYPESGAQWDALGRRALAVLCSLSALDTSGSWSPPVPGERTG